MKSKQKAKRKRFYNQFTSLRSIAYKWVYMPGPPTKMIGGPAKLTGSPSKTIGEPMKKIGAPAKKIGAAPKSYSYLYYLNIK
ncbi:MAG: hypothetical protein V4561_10455 [Bacteroidota bacterium]